VVDGLAAVDGENGTRVGAVEYLGLGRGEAVGRADATKPLPGENVGSSSWVSAQFRFFDNSRWSFQIHPRFRDNFAQISPSNACHVTLPSLFSQP
jgi:hypothetical protein